MLLLPGQAALNNNYHEVSVPSVGPRVTSIGFSPPSIGFMSACSSRHAAFTKRHDGCLHPWLPARASFFEARTGVGQPHTSIWMGIFSSTSTSTEGIARRCGIPPILRGPKAAEGRQPVGREKSCSDAPVVTQKVASAAEGLPRWLL